ncbi:MAG: hypothetical protein O3C05_02300 [Proteobacteria bacterium]|nr:hypothetical protein [Pseudomonadota bacterium]
MQIKYAFFIACVLHLSLLLIFFLDPPYKVRSAQKYIILTDSVVIKNKTNLGDKAKSEHKKLNTTQKKSDEKNTEIKKSTNVVPHINPNTLKVPAAPIITQSNKKILKVTKDKVGLKAQNAKKIAKKIPQEDQKVNQESLEKDIEVAAMIESLTKSYAVKKKDKSLDDIIDKNNAESSTSLSDIDLIKQQIQYSWSPITFAGNSQSIIVTVQIQLDIDGNIVSVRVLNSKAQKEQKYYRAFVDSILRAIHIASQLQNLPRDTFARWRNLELIFNLDDM